MQRRRRRLGALLCGAAFAATLAWSGAASARNDSCREWYDEHSRWKTEVVRRYLKGAPQRELDGALFEMLQREAYLTSCDTSVQVGRSEMVGWRLVGRAPEEYGSAVLESVLERAGFDVGLRRLFEAQPPALIARTPASPRSKWRRGGARGSN